MSERKNILLGIDIGGTLTKFGFVDFEGNILKKSLMTTCEFNDFEDYINSLVNKVNCELPPEYEIISIGVGAPNANYFTGYIEEAPNLKWKGKVNIKEKLQNLMGKPVFIINDANAGAIGEKTFGAAKFYNNFIFITLGTGLGCGIYCDGKLLYGQSGIAGEFGHTIVFKDGRQCNCGRKGCLETYVSATGLKRTAVEFLSKGMESALKNIPENKLTSKKIFEYALKGDKLAIESFKYTAEILGIALANIAAILNPEAIFLYGGLSNAGDFIFKPVRYYFDKYLLNVLKNTVKILPSGLPQDDASILGASALCLKELKKINL